MLHDLCSVCFVMEQLGPDLVAETPAVAVIHRGLGYLYCPLRFKCKTFSLLAVEI